MPAANNEQLDAIEVTIKQVLASQGADNNEGSRKSFSHEDASIEIRPGF